MQKFKITIAREIKMRAPESVGAIDEEPSSDSDGIKPIISLECERCYTWRLYPSGRVTAGCRDWHNFAEAREHYSEKKYIKDRIKNARVPDCAVVNCNSCNLSDEELAEWREARKLALKRLKFLERVYEKWRNS